MIRRNLRWIGTISVRREGEARERNVPRSILDVGDQKETGCRRERVPARSCGKSYVGHSRTANVLARLSLDLGAVGTSCGTGFDGAGRAPGRLGYQQQPAPVLLSCAKDLLFGASEP